MTLTGSGQNELNQNAGEFNLLAKPRPKHQQRPEADRTGKASDYQTTERT